jgi:hypothetical protein
MTTPPDFTSGQILTAAQMNAVGMWLVKSATLTSGNSNTITGAFTSDFTNYKIVVSNLQSSDVANMYMKMGTTATGYYYGGTRRSYAGTTTSSQAAGTTQWVIGFVPNPSNKSGGTIEIQMPQAAQRTTFQSSFGDSRTDGDGINSYTGYINDSTQYTSFTFFLDGAVTLTSCDIKVYGYTD